AYIQRAAGLERHVEALVAQALEQFEAVRLRQGLSAGHAYMRGGVAAHLPHHGLEVVPIAVMKRILGVAITAPQRAAGQADENRGKADGVGLPLQRMKNLIDAQSVGFECDLTQCVSAAILSRRCWARWPAGVSANFVATCESVALA